MFSSMKEVVKEEKEFPKAGTLEMMQECDLIAADLSDIAAGPC